MSEPKHFRWLALALLIPIVGLLGLIARAEFALRSAASFQVRIEGFDPRDLLHGHYLLYRYRFHWQGQSDCGEGNSVANPSGLYPDCCLCFTRLDPAGIDPPVRQVSCDQVHACDGWLFTEAVEPPLKYFVPEQRAVQLERALLERQASLEVSCVQGRARVGELFVDGVPWREALPPLP